MDAQAHQQRVEHGHHRGLGGREDAAVDAAEDDHRHQQGPARLQRGAAHRQAAVAIVPAQSLEAAPQVHEEHQHAADEQARHHAGDEQLADGHLGGHTEQDHGDGGRDHHAQLRRGGLQRGRVTGRVTVLDERRDEDGADGEGGGHGGARDRREDHAGEHAGHGQAALHAAHQRLGEVDQAARDAARFHEVAREDEEGDGGEREFVDRAEHLLGHEDQLAAVEQGQAQDGRAADGDGDGDAEGKAQQHRDEKGQWHGAVRRLIGPWRVLRCAGPGGAR